MADLADILIEGRRRKGWSQQELAVRASVSISTVTRAEQRVAVPHVNSLRHLAAAIGYDAEALVQVAREPGGRHPAAWMEQSKTALKIPGLFTGDQLGEMGLPKGPAAGMPAMGRVPHFGGVSAVRTDQREEIGGEFADAPDMGVDFVLTVDGQCMEPRYVDGEQVGCSIRRWVKEGFKWNKDYWIRFKDGQTTLKRVLRDRTDPEKFICQPLNPASRPFTRLKSDVEKAARVVVVMSG
jgi:transcriptional regulator with XRE-family HTH domain